MARILDDRDLRSTRQMVRTQMTAPAAIKATFADYRRIRTRKIGQLVFEISLEELHSAIEALGGEPSVNGDTWCAIALLTPEAAGRGSEEDDEEMREMLPPGPTVRLPVTVTTREKRSWADLSAAQQAGIRCNEEAFWRYLTERSDGDGDRAVLILNADEAAVYLRLICGVKSRSDLDKNPEAKAKWVDLERSYQIWLANPEG